MGVIQRQSIKQSIITYIGVLIGAVNILLIYPQTLSTAEFGLIQFVISTAGVIAPFAILGMGHVAIKFFPDFQNPENGHNGFLFFLLLVPTIGISFFYLLAFIFEMPLLNHFLQKTDGQLYINYVPYIVPLVALLNLSTIFSKYCYCFNRIAIPQLFNNLFLKIGLPSLCLLYFFDVIDFQSLMLGLLSIYVLITISFLLYIRSLGQLYFKPNFEFLTKPLLKKIMDFAGFGLLSGAGTMLAFQIDFVMLGTLGGLQELAIYSIAFFIANTIDIPRKAIEAIAAPIIAQAWKRNDLAHIEMLYQKSSLNLLIIGVFLLTGIWASIDHLFDLIPNHEKYEMGKYIVLILGITRIIDMMTGINAQIIALSKYYRFAFYAILALSVFSIITNLLLIPPFKIYGAALATFSALTLYNLLKLGFIYLKFNIQPFSWKTIWIILLGLAIYGLTLFIPPILHPFVTLLIKSVLVTVLYGGIILYFNVSQDITDLVQDAISKFLKR